MKTCILILSVLLFASAQSFAQGLGLEKGMKISFSDLQMSPLAQHIGLLADFSRGRQIDPAATHYLNTRCELDVFNPHPFQNPEVQVPNQIQTMTATIDDVDSEQHGNRVTEAYLGLKVNSINGETTQSYGATLLCWGGFTNYFLRGLELRDIVYSIGASHIQLSR